MTKSSSSSVQTLYDLCKKTFAPSGTRPPSSLAINRLCSLLGIEVIELEKERKSTCHHLPCSVAFEEHLKSREKALKQDSNLAVVNKRQKEGTQPLFEIGNTIAPADVGLDDGNKENDRGHGPLGIKLFNRIHRWAQPITYVDMHEGENFTMCMFCFPASSVIPLHDHPGMTVLSKVLYGSLHVKAYDWVEPANIQKSKGAGHATVRLAKLVVDEVLTAPCSTSVLYPKSGGNLHCFTAITPCAVLDILAPPYDEAAGRKCTYYHDYPCSSFPTGDGDESTDEKMDYAWVAEINTPEELYMRPGMYMGPPIQN